LQTFGLENTMRVPIETSISSSPVRIEVAGAVLNGDLSVPPDAEGLVVFAHGSGSSRHSSRNRAVAGVLQRSRLATLLLDLLTEREERTDVLTAEYRFDIQLLADRVVAARARPRH
jgi:predicted alpha/beta-hydrolase family hydrolase